MENPEKSQNKGEGTNTAEGCGRHRAALGCRGSGRGGQGILECVLTPTSLAARWRPQPSAVFWWMNAVDEGFFRIILP